MTIVVVVVIVKLTNLVAFSYYSFYNKSARFNRSHPASKQPPKWYRQSRVQVWTAWPFKCSHIQSLYSKMQSIIHLILLHPVLHLLLRSLDNSYFIPPLTHSLNIICIPSIFNSTAIQYHHLPFGRLSTTTIHTARQIDIDKKRPTRSHSLKSPLTNYNHNNRSSQTSLYRTKVSLGKTKHAGIEVIFGQEMRIQEHTRLY